MLSAWAAAARCPRCPRHTAGKRRGSRRRSSRARRRRGWQAWLASPAAPATACCLAPPTSASRERLCCVHVLLTFRHFTTGHPLDFRLLLTDGRTEQLVSPLPAHTRPSLHNPSVAFLLPSHVKRCLLWPPSHKDVHHGIAVPGSLHSCCQERAAAPATGSRVTSRQSAAAASVAPAGPLPLPPGRICEAALALFAFWATATSPASHPSARSAFPTAPASVCAERAVAARSSRPTLSGIRGG